MSFGKEDSTNLYEGVSLLGFGKQGTSQLNVVKRSSSQLAKDAIQMQKVE
jgi:hypothetical protein